MCRQPQSFGHWVNGTKCTASVDMQTASHTYTVYQMCWCAVSELVVYCTKCIVLMSWQPHSFGYTVLSLCRQPHLLYKMYCLLMCRQLWVYISTHTYTHTHRTKCTVSVDLQSSHEQERAQALHQHKVERRKIRRSAGEISKTFKDKPKFWMGQRVNTK